MELTKCNQELDQEEKENSKKEKTLIASKNTQLKLLENILMDYDNSQKKTNEQMESLLKEKEIIKQNIEQLSDQMKEMLVKKELFLVEDIEWERKTKLIKLETEEQIEAVKFFVRAWKIQNFIKKKSKKKRKNKKNNS